MHKDLMSKLLGVTVKSVYNYEKENRLIIKILNNYLTDEDAIEMIETGTIKRFENNSEGGGYLLIEYARYNLADKLHKIFATKGEGIIDKLNKLIPNKIFVSILNDIQNDEMFELQQGSSKETLINRIKGYEASLLEAPSKKQLVGIIEKNLSNIECYVLIKYHEEILTK